MVHDKSYTISLLLSQDDNNIVKAYSKIKVFIIDLEIIVEKGMQTYQSEI